MSKRASHTLQSPRKRLRTESPEWADWPAPASAMNRAREFISDIVKQRKKVLIVPDKDADGLSSGTLLYKTLVTRGLTGDKIYTHHLSKGNSVHSDIEQRNMMSYPVDCAIFLDQGSRPGRPLLPGIPTLIIDHHMSDQFPAESLVLTACHSSPIATTSLLTYCLLEDVGHEDWRAVLGVYGDLGASVAKWGQPPWPYELQQVVEKHGSKNLLDAVSAINAPRRTADYDVPRAWEILLAAEHPRDVAANAFLKLCKMDVAEETAKWARTAPHFSADGRVALVVIDSGFQIHPVIATRWAGSLGRKSEKLIMVMCANKGFNPDPTKISFSCRLPSSKRKLPEDERPDLIRLLKSYGDIIPGFNDQVGEDFARGHKEATGGIIHEAQFELLIDTIGIGKAKKKVNKAAGNRSIGEYFKKA